MRYSISGDRIQKPVNVYALDKASYACETVKFKNLLSEQLAVAAMSQNGYGDAVAAVAAVPTTYEIQMRSLAAKSVIRTQGQCDRRKTITSRKDVMLDYGG